MILVNKFHLFQDFHTYITFTKYNAWCIDHLNLKKYHIDICYFNLRIAHWFEEKKNANEIVCFFWCYFTINCLGFFLKKTERKNCHKFTWARRHHFRQRARLNPFRKFVWFFCIFSVKLQNVKISIIEHFLL